MSKIDKYEDLVVWQKAHELVLGIYEITKQFPAAEQFGLTIQLKRAAVSVPANISEGSTRQHTKELIQFLYIAKGSLGETEYYVRLAKDLGYLTNDKYCKLTDKCDEISRMIAGLINSLKKKGCN